MLALYLGVVAVGVFGPSPATPLAHVRDGARWIGAEARSVIVDGPAEASSTHTPSRNVVGDLDIGDLGNVVMFVPFGVLFPARRPRWRWWTIPAGVALSAGIELTQLVLLSWRSPSLKDIVWNSVGAAMGFSLWLAARAILQVRTSRAGRLT